MNAKGDANRSVRMTKQRLYQALITLLQQKSLREITVRELTELAGISRGTFYFHYTDIYALMDQMEAAQLKRLNELMDTLIPSISQEDVPTGGTEDQKYMLSFAVNGCFGTIAAWQENQFQPPPAEIARITWQAIRAVMEQM